MNITDEQIRRVRALTGFLLRKWWPECNEVEDVEQDLLVAAIEQELVIPDDGSSMSRTTIRALHRVLERLRRNAIHRVKLIARSLDKETPGGRSLHSCLSDAPVARDVAVGDRNLLARPDKQIVHDPAGASNRQEAYVRRKKLAGICVRCSRPSAPYTLCEYHRAYKNKYAKRNGSQRESAFDHIEVTRTPPSGPTG